MSSCAARTPTSPSASPSRLSITAQPLVREVSPSGQPSTARMWFSNCGEEGAETVEQGVKESVEPSGQPSTARMWFSSNFREEVGGRFGFRGTWSKHRLCMLLVELAPSNFPCLLILVQQSANSRPIRSEAGLVLQGRPTWLRWLPVSIFTPSQRIQLYRAKTHLAGDAAIHGVVPAVVGTRRDLVEEDGAVGQHKHLNTESKPRGRVGSTEAVTVGVIEPSP